MILLDDKLATKLSTNSHKFVGKLEKTAMTGEIVDTIKT